MEPDAMVEDVLSREECLRLLPQAMVGRVVFTLRALPAVQPVCFVVVNDTVMIGAGSALMTAVRDAVVAFQADHLDPVSHAGWSVTITGCAQEISSPDLTQRFGNWSGSQAELSHVVQIAPQLVRGLWLRPNGHRWTSQG